MDFKDILLKHKTLIYTVCVSVISVVLLITGIFYYINAKNEPAITVTEPQTAEAEILVHIKGGVAAPGVYALYKGARISDAIEAAGGTGISKNILDKINLAEKLTDGQEVIIPGIYLESPVNINTASLDELTLIPGISKGIARSIIEYRDFYGKFGDKEDVLEIPGILPKEYNLMEDYITVSDYTQIKK